jgi:hypothetical protein
MRFLKGIVMDHNILNEFCMIMGLEASDNALVHRLDMSCEIWFKIYNTDVLKAI